MRLVPLGADDRGSVSELLIATAAFSADEVGVALQLFDETFSKSCRPEPFASREGTLREGPAPVVAEADYEFVGAYDDAGRLLGYACFGATPATEGTYDLYWLAVHPAAQGRGAGRALVRWVEQELGTRGARLLVIETSSRTDYAHTREFYARGGYLEAARVRDFYAPADDRIILTTRLRAREVGVATR
jgi:GNAT superfamily N-acetyltransferase